MNIDQAVALDALFLEFHDRSKAAGWWNDPITGESLIPPEEFHSEEARDRYFPYVIAAKIALIHSETSEMLEAYRTDAMDDKLTDLPGVEVEAADILIRLGDLAGVLKLNVGLAAYRKTEYNAIRADHKLENRAKKRGKKF